MLGTAQKASRKSPPAGPRPSNASRALEWLWAHFRDVRNPRVLDCGPVSQSTLDVLLRRGAKLYVADLVTPAREGAPAFWDRSGKQPLFRLDDFLAQVPSIPPASLSAIFCWHLLDLIPRDSLPKLFERLCSYLEPNGALFCLLREPFLPAGAETAWRLEKLTVLGSSGEGRVAFPYPALTNREMERLAPSCTAKTFLTRFGRREVLAIK
jgi:methyltransferase family protein